MKKIITAIAATALTAACAFTATACNNDAIYVDTNAFFAPFEYYDANGEIAGVDVDIMNEVGKEMGKEVKFVNTEFNVIIDNVESGKQFDCGAAGITITAERQNKVDFSIPYYTAVQYAVFKTGELTADGTSADGKNAEYVLWTQLQGKKIGVQTDTTGDIYVGGEMSGDADGNGNAGELYDTESGAPYSGTELKKFSSAPVAVNALGNAIDVIVVDEMPAKYLASKNTGLECYPLYYDAETATEEQYAICVTKGNDKLLNAINKVLTKLIQEDKIDALVQKHLGLTV